MIKRGFDFTFSLLALILLSPLLLFVSFISFFVLGKPVFFKQKRIGKNGNEFNILKFRTMSEDECLSEVERLSPWGSFLRKTSIDELPELFNILKGEMSLVGPRPLLVEYLKFYTAKENARHSVLPGLTGLAQVQGRNSISWRDKLSYDLEYVQNQSFWLDCKIIFKTILYVLKRQDINSAHGLSMERFDNPLFILGAGGHGKSVLSSCERKGLEVRGFLDDSYKGVQAEKVWGKIGDYQGVRAILGIGNLKLREELVKNHQYQWKTIIDPTALVDKSATIGEGSIIMANAYVGPDTKIGKHVIINNGATVEHDCFIDDFSHIAPAATLCGGVNIGKGCLIGVGSRIIPNCKIASYSIIGGGATVTKNLEDSAVYTGVPAMKTIAHKKKDMKVDKKIDLSMAKPHIDEKDIDGVVEVLKSGHLSLGPKVVEFEEKVRELAQTKHAIAVSSGTAALHLILLAMDIGEGDEVMVPSFTFVSSVSTIFHVGATPVFVDIETETYCLDPKDVERKITPRTKAILGVDIFGHPADWNQICQIAKKHNLYTIDDSCEAIGASIGGRPIGSFADASTFAFYPNKQVTTGEGGIIVTSDDQIAERVSALRNQGRSSMGGWLKHDYLGFNYRMSELSASLGCTQIDKLDTLLEMREKVANLYNEELKDEDGFRLQKIKPGFKMSWFVYVVTLEQGFSRDRVINELEDRGIPARAYFDPIHTQPFIKKRMNVENIDLKNTLDIGSRSIALPFHPFMTKEEVEFVSLNLRYIIKRLREDKKAKDNKMLNIA